MRKFWINTKGNHLVKISLTSKSINDVVDGTTRLAIGLKQCTLFQYFMFDVFLINLLAGKEDRYKWLKSFIKTKVAHSILAIASKFSRVSPKTP